MKKIIIIIIAAALVFGLASCKEEEESKLSVTTLPSIEPTEPGQTETPSDALPTFEVPSDEPSPTEEPTETPSADGFVPDAPDYAGSGDTLFDIYESKALADLDGDGTDEEIIFEAGADKSTLYVSGSENTINISGLAQTFAITDVDKSDKYLELVFTDKYDSGLADTEFAYSYVYWYSGTKLTSMGSLMDVKFAGAWRGDFDAKKYFKADGKVFCLAHATELTDIWYMARFSPDGASRKFKDDYNDYAAVPVNTPEPLTIKAGKKCLLLAHGNSSYFGNKDIWIYDKFPHNAARTKNIMDGVVVVAQGGETMEVVAVVGQNWVKLQSTLDGSKGWVKIVKGKVQGYNVAPADIFDGIVIAG